ncbi:hypothetical protein [Streptomyces sp. NPDC014733]|uniref:hypothetical protein n=1 Tax=Streptomyces sp. NPDC014733 TaxID=3364885 RepID=UPI0036FA66BD
MRRDVMTLIAPVPDACSGRLAGSDGMCYATADAPTAHRRSAPGHETAADAVPVAEPVR